MRIFDRLHIYPGKKARAPRRSNQCAQTFPINQQNHVSTGQVSSPLDEERDAANERRRQLHQAGKAWNAVVHRLLAKLARAKWNEPSYLGVLPVFPARIRRSDLPDKIRWWAEHDIPPYDRYRCEAYFVELEVGHEHSLVFSVRSGQRTVRLENPTASSLEQALAEIIQSPPAIIPRQMGAAWD